MKNNQKSSRQAALEIFNKMDLKLPGLVDQLYTQYNITYEKYFGVHADRGESSWNEYCVRRDLFLQFLGKINLSAEIKNQETFNYAQNYDRYQAKRIK